MKLTNADITEYQRLVRERHNLKISKAQAVEEASRLVQFVRLVYKKPPSID